MNCERFLIIFRKVTDSFWFSEMLIHLINCPLYVCMHFIWFAVCYSVSPFSFFFTSLIFFRVHSYILVKCLNFVFWSLSLSLSHIHSLTVYRLLFWISAMCCCRLFGFLIQFLKAQTKINTCSRCRVDSVQKVLYIVCVCAMTVFRVYFAPNNNLLSAKQIN